MENDDLTPDAPLGGNSSNSSNSSNSNNNGDNENENENENENGELSEEHAAYLLAFQQEFEESNKQIDPVVDPIAAEKANKEYFLKHAANSAAQIVWLSNNAESESLAFGCHKYILAAAFDKDTSVGGKADELSEILGGLMGPK